MPSITAAQVVLLPDPVGPVTTTRPRLTSAPHLATAAGRPSVSASGASGTARNTNDGKVRWVKAVARKRWPAAP